MLSRMISDVARAAAAGSRLPAARAAAACAVARAAAMTFDRAVLAAILMRLAAVRAGRTHTHFLIFRSENIMAYQNVIDIECAHFVSH